MFQIPKHYISQISIFSTIFSLPQSKDGIEGLTEENPLILHHLSKVDFKGFLSVLIPLQVPPNHSNISLDVWKSALKLSTMWEVTALRDLAIRNMNQLDVCDMISLGSKYRISQWFLTGCTKLIMRSHGPTEEEGNLLGMGFVVQIYGLREGWLSRNKEPVWGVRPADYHQHDERVVLQIVRETFPDKVEDETRS